MIIKHFELQKKDLKKFQFFLLYGNNQGHVEETINDVLKPILPKNIYVYEESEIIKAQAENANDLSIIISVLEISSR